MAAPLAAPVEPLAITRVLLFLECGGCEVKAVEFLTTLQDFVELRASLRIAKDIGLFTFSVWSVTGVKTRSIILQKALSLFLAHADTGFTPGLFPNLSLMFEPDSLSGP